MSNLSGTHNTVQHFINTPTRNVAETSGALLNSAPKPALRAGKLGVTTAHPSPLADQQLIMLPNLLIGVALFRGPKAMHTATSWKQELGLGGTGIQRVIRKTRQDPLHLPHTHSHSIAHSYAQLVRPSRYLLEAWQKILLRWPLPNQRPCKDSFGGGVRPQPQLLLAVSPGLILDFLMRP